MLCAPWVPFSATGGTPGTVVGWGNLIGTPQPPGLTNALSISFYSHALAVLSDGTVAAWGDTTSGKTVVPPGLTNVIAVSAGDEHSLALLADGRVVQWGNSGMPPVPTGLNDAVAIAAGSGASLAVRRNGTVVAWASGSNPVTNVPPSLTNAVGVAAGQNFAVAVTRDGGVVAWGVNDAGQTIVPASATNVVAVDASPFSSQALRSDGTIVAWGYFPFANSQPPVGLSNVVSMGDWRALKSDGTITVWGAVDSTLPNEYVPPAGLSNVVAVATGTGRHYVIVQVDDAHPPSAAAQNVVAVEGLGATQATVTVTLSVPMAKAVSLQYATADGTAIDGQDYLGARGQVVFPPNVTTQTFNVTVLGGVLQGPTKSFFVNFSAPSNAVLFTTQVVVTIINNNTLTVPPGFGASVIATNFALPTAFDFAPDGRFFVCEQAGLIQVVKGGVKLSTPFVNIPVTTEDVSEAGLLGIALDPHFASNNFVYVYYTVPGNALLPQDHNRISRFTAQGDTAASNSEFVLLDLDPLASPQQHNGGGLHFGPDGKLYAGVGDDGNGTNSQCLTNVFGKILRINADGTIPSDNPFFLTATGNNRAIWALGLRNPFSFAFHPQTGRMLINDVGLSTWEEIDEGHAGSNYGWPIFEGFGTNSAYQDPVFVYGHTGIDGGCAIVAGAFYAPTQDNFPPEFEGNYFFADYCNGWIRRLTNGDTAADFITGLPVITGMQVGPDGALYALAGSASRSLYRISWKDPTLIGNLVKVPSGPMQMTATARTNHVYVLDASTNLVNWTSIETNQSLGESVIFSDAAATNFNRRFYRVRE